MVEHKNRWRGKSKLTEVKRDHRSWVIKRLVWEMFKLPENTVRNFFTAQCAKTSDIEDACRVIRKLLEKENNRK